MSDNSWFKRGEIPPVGTKCIADFSESRNEFLRQIGEVECEIVMHSMCAEDKYETAVFRWKAGKAYRYHAVIGDSNAFRPIKTERELAIEEMAKFIDSVNYYDKEIAEKLYDAGYRKTTPD